MFFYIIYRIYPKYIGKNNFDLTTYIPNWCIATGSLYLIRKVTGLGEVAMVRYKYIRCDI